MIDGAARRSATKHDTGQGALPTGSNFVASVWFLSYPAPVPWYE